MKESTENLLAALAGIVIILVLCILGTLMLHRLQAMRDEDRQRVQLLSEARLRQVGVEPALEPKVLNSRKVVPYDTIRLDPSLKVAYLTDVEGNWEYFLACVEQSDGLRLVGMEEGGAVARIDLLEGWRLIFGGDVCDKGRAVGGSVRVTRSLLKLKQRYPERVTFILGNRDVNKLRLTSEVRGPACLPAWHRPRVRALLLARARLRVHTRHGIHTTGAFVGVAYVYVRVCVRICAFAISLSAS